MPEVIAPTLVVAVTSPRPLSKEQRAIVREELQASMPAHVLVIVLDAGMTADVFPLTQKELELFSTNGHGVCGGIAVGDLRVSPTDGAQ